MAQEKTFQTEWLGEQLTIKTGKLAQQADAAVTVQYGETVVMATVVESKEEKDVDFFPLMVGFEERLYAAGMIKGSRWIKREGRPSDESVLTSRMIDRSIRPLFNEESRNEVQILITSLSVDKKNPHDIVALIAASAALSISGVDWKGPIGGIRAGLVQEELVFNPTYQQLEESGLDLIVAGTEQKTIMIESGGREIKEDKMYEAIIQGQKKMQPAIDLIKQLQQEVPAKEKNHKTEVLKNGEEEQEEQEKQKLVDMANQWLSENTHSILFDQQYHTKGERKAAVEALKQKLDYYLYENGVGREKRKYALKKTVEKAVEAEVSKQILENQKRVDGRDIKEIRSLSAEVGILPRNHGAGLFSRGETQIMSIVTLGSPGLEQYSETIEGMGSKGFMHHYNFPPYSVGETKPIFGPSRRDIGHGSLAEKALRPLIPEKEDFPYTIRVVSETLSSNGSSSMGATCASSLALMDAGVPIKKQVGGIAMGLASNKDMSKWQVITDLQDLEDGEGGMDFKITGTKDGLTAIQLDTKTNGLTEEIIKTALKQGREALNQVLETMNQAISQPNPELSPYAPLVLKIKINPDKIRDVVGAGGKIINKIIEEKDVSIDIEKDGTVIVCGNDKQSCQEAVKWIEELTHEFEAGEKFTGTVTRLMDFGAFVEVLPGREGLVHVSEMAPYHVSSPKDFLGEGDEVKVKVKEIDDMGRLNLTMKDLEENQHLWKDKKGEGTPNNKFNNNRNNSGKKPFSKPPHKN